MKILCKFASIILLSLLMLSVFSIFVGRFPANAQPAHLVGIAYDNAVDSDSDGDYDYLEVGIEVSVNVKGQYEVYVGGLKNNITGQYIYLYDYALPELDVGTHVVIVKLHGPAIYSSGINPDTLTSVNLIQLQYLFSSSWLDNLYDLPLSKQYFYSQFDAPFGDLEAKLTVYPDGRVVMGGTMNYTPLPSPYISGFDTYANIKFAKTDGSTQMTANIVNNVQPFIEGMFPYAGSSFNLLGTYSSGIAEISIDGSVTFPQEIKSQFPLNLSDFTVVADYFNSNISGTISAPLISGVPLATISIDFHGNLTDLYLSDELDVVYGYYPNFDLNVTEEYVEQMLLEINSTIPGTGPESLYNMTNGILECETLNTNIIKKIGGATITFDAHIKGDFLGFFIYYVTEGYENPGLDWFAEAFVSSIENGHFELAYTMGTGAASMHLTFTINLGKLWTDLESTLPPEVPLEQRRLIEFLMNTTLCSVESATVSWTYENGKSDMNINATIGPDFNAELNYINNVFVTYGMAQPIPPQWLTVNATWLDLSNLSATFNITRTSATGSIDGFTVKPPKDPVELEPFHFKLQRLLNLTKYFFYQEPPMKDTRLKVTIEGGYNATHIVTLIKPPTVHEPDMTAPDQTSMMWLNQSVSSLKDLIFDIRYQGVFVWDAQTYRVIFDSNSTVSNFNFNRDAKQFTFDVEGLGGTTGHQNISIPRGLLHAPPDEWVIVIDGNPPLQYLTDYNVTETATHTFISFKYAHSLHTITVTGTEVVREFDSIMLPLTLVILTLITAVVATKNRKKLGVLKMRYQNAIQMFVGKLH